VQIKQLVVVAGPKAAGKSFLLKRLKHGTMSDVRDKLGLSNSDWQQVSARQFDPDARRPFTTPRSKVLILHYEITRAWKYLYDYAHDPALKLLQAADKTTFLTLLAPTHVLLARFVQRDITSWRRHLPRLVAEWSGRANEGNNGRRKKFVELYENGAEVERIYREWFRFCSRCSVQDHCTLDTSAGSHQLLRLDHASPNSYEQLIALLRPKPRAA